MNAGHGNAKCGAQNAKNGLAGKRVLIVLPTLDMGGAERQALVLAEYLKGRVAGGRRGEGGVAVAALFGGTGKQAVRQACARIGVACLRVSMPELREGGIPTIASLRQFMRDVAFLRPDVLLPYTILPNTLCGLAIRWCGAASVWNQRDSGGAEVELPGRWMQEEAMARTSAFVSNSQGGREYLMGCGVADGKISVVPNGVRLAASRMNRSAWREKLGVGEQHLAVCMIGNIQPLKDHETLLRAWALVVDRMVPQKLVLCLAGELASTAGAMQELAGRLKIAETVRWLGAVDDVAGLLGAMDLAVLSSRKEGLPNGVLEPMAAGLAVAATDVAGVREGLGEGEQVGYLAAAGNAEALAQKMVALLEDAGLRRRLGTANRQRIGEHFAAEVMGRRVAALILEALGMPCESGRKL